MRKETTPMYHLEPKLSPLTEAEVWLPACIFLGLGLLANAQNLSGTLTSGTYSASGTLTNCAGVGPPPTGCATTTLGNNANVC